MQIPASYWIEKFQLIPHVEGGAYKEVYRSPMVLASDCLSPNFSGERHICTSIYFLLQKGEFSAFHRIHSDETWHFYFGDSLAIYEIDNNGELNEHKIGSDPEKGESFQCTIKAGNWFAARIIPPGIYCLAGCTVSPGFDFEEFELGKRADLIKRYPKYKSLIDSLTHI